MALEFLGVTEVRVLAVLVDEALVGEELLGVNLTI